MLREGKNEGKKNGILNGSRTRVAGMKTRCPRPLDDEDACLLRFLNIHPEYLFVKRNLVFLLTFEPDF